MPPPDPQQPTSNPEAGRARGKAPPAGQAAGRDRAAHQRRKRAAQEALHQPRHPRRGLRRLLRRAAPQDRGHAAPQNFPELAGQKLYGELTMIVTVNHDGRVLDTEVVETSGNLHAGPPRARPSPAAPAPFGTLQRRDAPQGRPDRGGVALQVHARRNAGNQAHRAADRAPMDQLLRDGQPGGAQQVAVDPRALCRADRPAAGLRPAAGAAGRLRRRACAPSRAEGGKRLQRHRAVQVRGRRAGRRSCSAARARWPAPATCCASTATACIADNTDGIGLVNDIQRNAGVALAGRDLLLVGAGGAAAGVLGPLLEAGPRRIVVANRTLAKARGAGGSATPRWRCRTRRAAARPRAGRRGRQLRRGGQRHRQQPGRRGVPVPPACCKPGALAFDMMYGPAAAGFLDWARAHGAVAARRPGHAGGAGGRGLPALARRAPAVGAGAGRTARGAVDA